MKIQKILTEQTPPCDEGRSQGFPNLKKTFWKSWPPELSGTQLDTKDRLTSFNKPSLKIASHEHVTRGLFGRKKTDSQKSKLRF